MTNTLVPRFPAATPPSTADVWYPPAESKACRKPALRSRGSSRGAIVGPDNRIRLYESFLEARIMLVLMARPDVAQIDEQQQVNWRDQAGRLHWHVFDLVVTTTSGERIAVAVKPFAKAEKQKLAAKLAEIAKHIPRRFADRVALMTERSIDRIASFNGEALLAALHCPRTEADAAVERVVSSMAGAATIADIARAAGDAAAGFWAVVRLIANGVLKLVAHCRITASALVQTAAPAWAEAA